jgi:hypothetical protein
MPSCRVSSVFTSLFLIFAADLSDVIMLVIESSQKTKLTKLDEK